MSEEWMGYTDGDGRQEVLHLIEDLRFAYKHNDDPFHYAREERSMV